MKLPPLPDFVFEIIKDSDGYHNIDDCLFRCEELYKHISEVDILTEWLFPEGFEELEGDGPWYVAAAFLEVRYEHDVIFPYSELDCEVWLVEHPGIGPFKNPKKRANFSEASGGNWDFVVAFEDPDKGIAVFDNEPEARAYFERARDSWNCHLYRRVAS